MISKTLAKIGVVGVFLYGGLIVVMWFIKLQKEKTSLFCYVIIDSK